MLRRLRVVLMAAGMVAVVACGGQDGGEDAPETDGGLAGGGTPTDSPSLSVADQFPIEGIEGGGGGGGPSYRLIACSDTAGLGAKAEAEVDSAGTGNQPLRTAKRVHELHVKKGTVPAGRRYVFRITNSAVTTEGCRVKVEQVTAGPINASPDAFTLRIRCEGHGQADCPADRMIRLDSSTRVTTARPEGTGPKADRHWVAELSSLSTYALATPGGPGSSSASPAQKGAGK